MISAAVETFEKPFTILLIDARPLIFDSQFVAIFLFYEPDGDHSVPGREIRRIGHQVVQGNIDRSGVDSGKTDVVPDIKNQLKPLAQ